MDSFSSLSSKFINITSRIDMLDYIEDHHRTKLNALLNDLTTLDYKCLPIIDHSVSFPQSIFNYLIKFVIFTNLVSYYFNRFFAKHSHCRGYTHC